MNANRRASIAKTYVLLACCSNQPEDYPNNCSSRKSE
jgi:hypothetical protein